MCLDVIDKVCKYEDGVYYKVFKRTKHEGLYRAQYFPRLYKLGAWYRKRKREPSIFGLTPSKIVGYEPGFHAFVCRQDAVCWGNMTNIVVLKIELRGVRISGSSGYGKVVVADRMKILEG